MPNEPQNKLGYRPTEQVYPSGVEPTVHAADAATRSLVTARGPAAPPAWLHPHATLAQGRFEVVRVLGVGGMGSVCEVIDRERAQRVALKTLHCTDPAGVYRFKTEFRSLADLHHPNLIRLHELFFESEHWFFTMELLQGQPFDSWARPQGRPELARLRAALGQLVEAVDAIHQAGKLHRDIKPNNVLVSEQGHVVVLDFGLVVERASGAGQTLIEASVMGTPDFMSPEQAAGQPADVGSDYYAIGVMLFEALSGVLPFHGNAAEVLAAKQRDPAPAAHVSPAQREDCRDLEQLCDQLLSRVPGERPSAASILARLPPRPSASVRASERARPSRVVERAAPLGRERELERLRAAYRATQAGEAVMLTVTGDSGIGKTALCQAFLDEVRAFGEAVVMRARCYEQEKIPFKVLDGLVDEISRQLRRMAPEQAAALLPRDAFALARLFPVLERVGVINLAPARAIADAQDLQRRALSALHELLARMRDRAPLVIHLDDLQWTDADSAKVLGNLLVRRTPVPMLVLASFRGLDGAHNPWLANVLSVAQRNPTLQFQALPLGPLSERDGIRLAQRLLAADVASIAQCEAIARQAGGSPFFVAELARFAVERGTHDPALSLDAVIAARIGEQPASARRVLETLAVAGRPLAYQVALAAAQASYEMIDRLRAAHLLRISDDSPAKLIDCYHDRIREHLHAGLSAAQTRGLCERLCSALSEQSDADLELLSRCLEVCGDTLGAASCLVQAGQRAFQTFAFDQAAELYQRALAMHSAGAEQTLDRSEQLGRALEHAGRGAEAAATYLRAARMCRDEASLELRRRAAEQLLGTGHVEDGTRVLRDVCRELGVPFPVHTASALLAWLGTQTRLRLSAIELEPGPHPLPDSSAGALRLRTARTIVAGLLGYLPLHGACAADRYLLMAARAGQTDHLVRALGFAAYVQTLIHPGSRRATRLLSRMVELAQREDSPEAGGFASLMSGMAAHHQDASPLLAATHLTRALSQLRGCPGMEWEIDAAHIYLQMSAFYSGRYLDIVRSTPGLIEEAMRRGRVWAGAMLSGFAGMPAWICSDDVQGYRLQLRDARRGWGEHKPLRWPDYFMLVGEAMLETYLGDAARGFELLTTQHYGYERSRLTTGTGAVGFAGHIGRCAAGALQAARRSASSAQRGIWRQALARSERRLERQGTAKARGSAHALRAALELDDGQCERTVAALRRAIVAFDEAEMALYCAAARRRLGQLLGGDQGRTLVAAGDSFMRSLGIKNLEAMTELGCPGCRS